MNNNVAISSDNSMYKNFQQTKVEKNADYNRQNRYLNASKINFKDESIGLFSGICSYIGLKKLVSKIYKPYVIKKLRDLEQIPPTQINDIANDMIRTNGLKDKNIKIQTIAESQTDMVIQQIIDTIRETNGYKIQKKMKLEKFFEGINKKLIKKVVEATAKNNNAFYVPKINTVFTGTKTTGALLHELGHAINSCKSKPLKKLILISRILPLFVLSTLCFYPIVNMMSVNTKKTNKAVLENFAKINSKNKPGTSIYNFNKNMFELNKKIMKFNEKLLKLELKAYKWIKDNAGKLLLITAIPTLIEEGIASWHGQNYAKKVLDANNLSKLKSSLKAAWSSYLIMGLATAGAALLGIYVRDKVVGQEGLNKENS
ncbi:MAG: hypothetical protein PHC34_13400 [Candidatus Gastranaerophilales bacterium]|nr:hypothetical protein [Candidatus Gastranaerophilales bacterium]